MGKRRTILYLATVVLLVFVVCLCFAQRERSGLPFSVWVSAGEKTESISLWESDTGECYVFLPAYAQLEQVRIHLHIGNPVSLDGVQLEDGMLCDVFQPEISYALSYNTWGMTKQKTVTFLQSASVAAMHIDTQSGSMEFIHEEKGNEETGAMRLYNHEGVLDYDGELESIKGRGNATWTNSEKKPYSLTLAQNADLLGMGEAQSWILLANAFDPSNLRNKIVYEFAKTVAMAYSPDSQWVDVYLNGEYTGLYLLCERNEIHPERVAISENGSFLVSLELKERLVAQNYPYITTDAKQALRIHYPGDVSGEYLAELEAQWQAMENAFLAEDGIDPETGRSWDEQIDLESWARKYLVEEIFGSIDAAFMSQYFYVDGKDSQRIYPGPVWDFDNAVGLEETWQIREPNILITNRLQVRPGCDAPWFYALWQKEEFKEAAIRIFKNDFSSVLDDYIYQQIPKFASTIEAPFIMNQIRWEVDSSDAYGEARKISDYLEKRKDFLTDIWLDRIPYHTIKADQAFGSYYAYYAVYDGEIVDWLPGFEDTPLQTFCGWYYKDTNEPFDPDRPITEDIEIYAKWQDKPTKKLDQLLKLVPLGVIAVMGVGLLWVEVKRWKRRR